MSNHRGSRERGQVLAEFALAISIFLVLLMGVFDLGFGIYKYNGVSEAAREIARVTSVHPGGTLGTSTQTASVVATQQGLIPGLTAPSFACVDITGAAVAGTCRSGNWVRVTVTAPYTPVTGNLLGILGFGTFTFSSTSTVELQ